MSRVVAPGLDLGAEAVELPAEAAHYVLRVLRLGPGARVTLLDGRGGVATAVLEAAGGRRVRARILEREAAPAEPGPRLRLVLALPKGEKTSDVVRRVTELGVAAVHPALSERSVPRPEPRRAAERVARLRRVAAEATRQCGRSSVPEVAELESFEAALAAARGTGPAVVLWEEERGQSLGEALEAGGGLVAGEATLAVGPEGGLTEAEVQRARGLGYVPASLGPLVLRVETAAVTACAVALDRLGGLLPRGRRPAADHGQGRDEARHERR